MKRCEQRQGVKLHKWKADRESKPHTQHGWQGVKSSGTRGGEGRIKDTYIVELIYWLWASERGAGITQENIWLEGMNIIDIEMRRETSSDKESNCERLTRSQSLQHRGWQGVKSHCARRGQQQKSKTYIVEGGRQVVGRGEINGAEVERINVIKFVDNECKQDQLWLTDLIFNSKISPTSSKNTTMLGD